MVGKIFVFHRCRLTADEGVDKVYLGRPWRPYAFTLFVACEMGPHIRPEGWDNWRNPENERTVRYGEFEYIGPGARIKERVSWSKQLTPDEVKPYLDMKRFFTFSDEWLP